MWSCWQSSNDILFIHIITIKLSAIKCPSKRQIHEATMCYTKKHWKSMGGYSKSGTGEGAGLVDFNENRCVVSECYECMICICHKNNTCKKEQFYRKRY